MTLSSRQKKILVRVGYPLLFLVTFVFALFYSFPYARLKDRVVEALSDKYDVTVASVDHTFMPGGIVFKTVMLKTRPTKPDEKPVVIVLDEVRLDLGFLGLLRGKVDVGLDAKIGSGRVEGDVEYSKSGLVANLETHGLPLSNLPGVSEAVGLPMAGGLNADLELHLPGMKFRNAEGHLKLSCDACTVGDGVAKMKMKPPEGHRPARTTQFGQEGVTVPKLDFGAASAELEITRGIGTIKSFSAASKDGTLKLEGRIEFKDPFSSTMFPGCMTFTLSPDLRKREPDFSNIEFMLPPQAKQADGSFAIPTKGKLSELRWDVKRRCGATPADDLTAAERPQLGVPITNPDDDGIGRRTMDVPPLPTPAAGVAPAVAPVPTPTGVAPTPGVPAPGTAGPELQAVGRGGQPIPSGDTPAATVPAPAGEPPPAGETPPTPAPTPDPAPTPAGDPPPAEQPHQVE